MVAGHFLARDENIFTIFEGSDQAPGGGGDPALQVHWCLGGWRVLQSRAEKCSNGAAPASALATPRHVIA